MELESVVALSRDLRKAAATLSDLEARYLVDAYYQMQDQRIRADNQLRSMGEEPHDVLVWYGRQSETLENQVKGALDVYSKHHPVGPWLRSVKGVGPVIAAGLLAHIDITKAPTVGHIWRYSGLDPTSKWGKGEKRPWNASLKVVCWKLGESFVKVSGKEDAYYGHIYRQRKDKESAANEAGAFEIAGTGGAGRQEDRQGYRRLQGLLDRQAAACPHPRPGQEVCGEAVPK